MERLDTLTNKVWKIILRVFLIIKKRKQNIQHVYRSYIYTVVFHENGVPIVKFPVIMQ